MAQREIPQQGRLTRTGIAQHQYLRPVAYRVQHQHRLVKCAVVIGGEPAAVLRLQPVQRRLVPGLVQLPGLQQRDRFLTLMLEPSTSTITRMPIMLRPQPHENLIQRQLHMLVAHHTSGTHIPMLINHPAQIPDPIILRRRGSAHRLRYRRSRRACPRRIHTAQHRVQRSLPANPLCQLRQHRREHRPQPIDPIKPFIIRPRTAQRVDRAFGQPRRRRRQPHHQHLRQLGSALVLPKPRIDIKIRQHPTMDRAHLGECPTQRLALRVTPHQRPNTLNRGTTNPVADLRHDRFRQRSDSHRHHIHAREYRNPALPRPRPTDIPQARQPLRRRADRRAAGAPPVREWPDAVGSTR